MKLLGIATCKVTKYENSETGSHLKITKLFKY